MTRPEAAKGARNSAIAGELSKLPVLPDEIVYFDDYGGETRRIEAPARNDVWRVRTGGHAHKLDFGCFTPDARVLLKHWANWLLSWGSPGTLRAYFWANARLDRKHGAGPLTAVLGRI
jgi:hypothetical protein